MDEKNGARERERERYRGERILPWRKGLVGTYCCN